MTTERTPLELPSAREQEQIEQAALALLHHNRRTVARKRRWPRRIYTCPSPEHYPFQWFWDSCFHAVALAHLEPAVAAEELDALLARQGRTGFLPHVIFWERARLADPALYWAWLQSASRGVPKHSALIQPPVLAAALETYAEVTGDLALVRRLLPGVDRYYDYLAGYRTAGDSPLLVIFAPWESGMDHRPSYDAALGLSYPASPRELILQPRVLDLANRALGYDPRRMARRGLFRVEDVLVNAVYAEGLECLAALHDRLGDEEGDPWRARAAQVGAAIRERLRGPDGFFYDRDRRGDRLLPVRTVAGLTPLLSRHAVPDAEAGPLLEAIDDPEAFGTPYPVPSVAVSEPAFVPGSQFWGAGPIIWRGPTWINLNWLLWRALRRRGEEERARRLAASAAALVLRSGFREHYHPATGAGFGALSFGWSTLVVDMLRRSG